MSGDGSTGLVRERLSLGIGQSRAGDDDDGDDGDGDDGRLTKLLGQVSIDGGRFHDHVTIHQQVWAVTRGRG